MMSPPAINIPPAPAPPPVFGEIQGTRPTRRSMTPTFLGSSAAPTGAQLGTSTLLGQ